MRDRKNKKSEPQADEPRLSGSPTGQMESGIMAWYSQTIDILRDSVGNHRAQLPVLAATGASLTVGLLLRSLLTEQRPQGSVLRCPQVIASSAASDAENENGEIPLPNDVLPGARDVPTPYGSMRVYEWGPVDGPKVLFVHGITTPCIALGGVAHALADQGCRVMLFDLFGRGYSDCPTDLPQDDRLFATQILLALSTSSVSWTGAGSGKFSLVGYSLGGGIAASFASFFPQLLSSLVLLAPAGLIRDSQISFQSRLLYSRGLIPEHYAADALTEELPSQGGANTQLLSRAYPHVTVPGAVKWQVNCHAGFVHAFMSSMQHGPILQQRQRESWERLGEFLSTQSKLSPEEQQDNGLPSDKVIIMCGEHDSVIVKDELVPDATSALQGNVVFKYFNAGHEFPSTKYDDVARALMEVLH
ncbi:putative alpha/beta hydrolase family protein [Aspergillus nomiae NRRL 13137]|uniref:Putative alpha/beta hydrolase family protein n=1 Tax=Aspergillus nomiae NRRL (strain ATCC 15546 / NRRL 13137 / CBS 260.88 / M93) TaxID=1509407 RepID=A0A0L1J8V4_ASPN3|nr:putative alpha/beta hydrolase family protein [Aspergillus nomiae NRRL 13137]KNG88120.1 putative alpha/beta hydrolase family protein [Aspergillus nomiae NRRL 13137]